MIGIGLGLNRGANIWTPRRLFAGGTVGALYDINDASTLFEDAAGTTPASVDGVVGLVLDKSQGLALGVERAQGADFSAWANGVTFPWDTMTDNGGALTLANSTEKVALANHPDSISVTAGKSYKVIVTVARESGSYDVSVRASAGSAALATTSTLAVGGDISLIMHAATTENVVVQVTSRAGTGAQALTIAGVSVRELPGYHASQSTGLSKPTLKQDAGSRLWLDDDEFDDSMTVTLPAGMSATSTVAYARPTTGAEINTVDLSAGGAYTIDGDYYACVIVDGALTADQTARLTAWLNRKAGV